MFGFNFRNHFPGKGRRKRQNKWTERPEDLSTNKNNQSDKETQTQKVISGDNSSVVCVCPRCGYIAPHERGIPCRSNYCPTCDVLLERRRKDEITGYESIPDKKPVRKVPFVNITLCTGCGECLNVCPANAIVITNGKARIIEEACKKCRKCVLACPAKAIS